MACWNTKAYSWICALVLMTFLAPDCFAQKFPDFGYAPPNDWQGATFALSQNYPATLPPPEHYPWLTIDFKAHPDDYLWAVLHYCFEGNVDIDFLVQKNTVRMWYHAPWLHFGPNGREFVRGLTKERGSRKYELAPTQTEPYRNFAVGFYNASGGYAIGRVWQDSTKPDAKQAMFPEGTVTFKLLFTTAPEATVPMLTGSPEWSADIDRSPTAQQVLASKVRLLQIDVAVKDQRSLNGGWVFGTLHYDASVQDQTPWLRLRPLALMWGDDPSLTAAAYATGTRPAEGWVNPVSPIVQYRTNPPSGTTPPSTMGWAGRGNGPVDNSVSSCLSCHSTAQIPATSPMTPPASLSDSQKLRWFRDTSIGEAFDSGSTSLDFSLQLGVGIQNLEQFQASVKNLGGFFSKKLAIPPGAMEKRREYRFTREPD